MIGAITEAYYGPPSPEILSKVERLLSADLYSIAQRFYRKYGGGAGRKTTSLPFSGDEG